ncbi:MAG: AbrB/MazE/SpoVT family DNA-binding domain-containing protein [Mycobacteriales bacterium]
MTYSAETAPHGEIEANGQGRVTIPAQVRRAAGITPGAPLLVYVEDERVVIETRAQLLQRVRDDVAKSWTGPGSVVQELIGERRANARRSVVVNASAGNSQIF